MTIPQRPVVWDYRNARQTCLENGCVFLEHTPCVFSRHSVLDTVIGRFPYMIAHARVLLFFCSGNVRPRLLCLVFYLPGSARGPRHLVTRPGPLPASRSQNRSNPLARERHSLCGTCTSDPRSSCCQERSPGRAGYPNPCGTSLGGQRHGHAPQAFCRGGFWIVLTAARPATYALHEATRTVGGEQGSRFPSWFWMAAACG